MLKRSHLSSMVRRGAIVLFILGTMLTILGGRWAFIGEFGGDVPEWDQWDAEAAHALLPWYRGENILPHLWIPHNEHRVILTKVANLAATVINGHWDQRYLAVLNAFLPALLAASIIIWTLRHYSARRSLFLFLVLAFGLGSPVAWQNVLGGFHSQQFFLILTGWAGLALLPFSSPPSLTWWAGATALVLGLGSMGSGFVAGAGVVGLCLARIVVQQVAWRTLVPSLVLGLLVTAVGFATRVNVEAHTALRVSSLTDFQNSLHGMLTWPSLHYEWWALGLWSPWVMLGLNWVHGKRGRSDADLVVLGLGGWVLVQILATVVMRGAGGGGPASRYIDTLVVGAIANLLSLVALTQNASRGPARWAWLTVATVWTSFFAYSTFERSQGIIFGEMAGLPTYRQESEVTTRSYVIHQQRDSLLRGQIPYPGVDGFQARLDRKPTFDLLPASVRKPIVEWSATENGPFRPVAPTRLDNAHSPTVDSNGQTGLPPTLWDWGAEKTWSSYNRVSLGQFISDVQAVGDRHLRIDVAGTWSKSGVKLELRDGKGVNVLATLKPELPKDGTWQPVFFTAPSVPFRLVAIDQANDGWLAFTAVREEAVGSRWARLATEVGLQVLFVGLGMGLASALVLIVWPGAQLSSPSSS